MSKGETMTLFELTNKVDEIANAFVEKLAEVQPEDLGLDRRSAYRLFVGDDVIGVPKGEDGVLQYYGGFEYVDKSCRVEIGSWVFYSSEDERVQNCLDYLNQGEEDNG